MENYTIDNAISEMQDFAKETNMFVGDPHAAKIADWLTELKGLKDGTPITSEFLFKRFLNTSAGWRRNFDTTKILIQQSGDTYHILIYTREYMENTAYIKTIGQLRMFLTICGLTELVKKLKS